MALGKARVQLLNPDTGIMVEEVDILSTSSVISYVNDTPTTMDFRGIPAGTTFKEEDKITVQDILDNILYPYQEMELESIASIDGKDVSEDTIIYKEKFHTVDAFTFSSKIKVGNVDTLTFRLKRYNNISGSVSTMEDTVSVVAGSEYMYTKEIDEISEDTTIQLVITDGTSSVVSPSVEFKFIYPVYIGYCDSTQFVEESDVYQLIINPEKATDYFNTLIANKSIFLEKRVIPVQDVQSIIIPDPLYSKTELHPCILYPNTWHKVESILDCNDNVITGGFIYNNQLSIKPDNKEVHKVQYSVYTTLDPFNVQLAATERIMYKFETGTGSIDYNTIGTPSLVGFDPLNHHPLDLRLEVNTYKELHEIEYTYDGMIVFVHDIHSYFRYDKENDVWINTNQEFLFGNTIPPLDLGKGGDIYINLSSGHIYQKYQDIRWEDKGIISVGLSEDILPSIDIWQEGKMYEIGEYVFWKDKYWKALEETSSEPGTDITWLETKPTMIKGADGEPGPAATVEIADVLVTDNVDDADVINLGDKFHARLRFIVPRGAKGEPGDQGENAPQEELDAINNIINESKKNIINLQNETTQLKDGQSKIQDQLTELNTDILNTINLNITNLEKKHDNDIATLQKGLSDINSNISNLQSKHDNDTDNLKNSINNVQNSVTQLDTKHTENINTLQSQITNTTSMVIGIQTKHNTDMEDIDSKLTNIGSNISGLQTQINNTDKSLSSYKESNNSEIFKLQNQIKLLSDNQTSSSESSNESFKEIQSKLNTINSSITDLDNKYTEKSNELQSSISNNTTEINSLKEKHLVDINSLQGQINSLSGNQSSSQVETNNSIKNLQDRINNSNTEITNLQKDLTQVSKSIDTKISTVNGTISSLESKHDSAISSLQTQINTINTNISNLNISISDLEEKHDDDITNLQSKINTTNTNVSSLQTKHDTDIANLQKQINSLSGDQSSSEIQINDTLDNLQSQIDDIDTDINGLQTSLSNLSTTVSDLNTKHNTDITGLQTLVSDLSTKHDTDITSLQEQLTAANKTITELQNKITELTDKIVTEAAISGNKVIFTNTKGTILFSTYTPSIVPVKVNDTYDYANGRIAYLDPKDTSNDIYIMNFS